MFALLLVVLPASVDAGRIRIRVNKATATVAQPFGDAQQELPAKGAVEDSRDFTDL